MEKTDTQENYLCPYIEACDFVQQYKTMTPELIRRTLTNYCHVTDSKCARRLLYRKLGPKFVPPLLLPRQLEWANQIIAESKENSNSPADAEKSFSAKNKIRGGN